MFAGLWMFCIQVRISSRGGRGDLAHGCRVDESENLEAVMCMVLKPMF